MLYCALEIKDIILGNIRLLRKIKNIKAETIANSLGISQGEYSKLENGLKPNWKEYIDEVAKILGVTFFELALPERVIEKKNGKLLENENFRFLNDENNFHERIITLLNEKVELKEELMQSLKKNIEENITENKNIKMRLFEAEARIVELEDENNLLKRMQKKQFNLGIE